MPAPLDARCANHPDAPAIGDCTRCGAFVCHAEWTFVEGAGYCGTCAIRDDVDWVEAFRKKYWGKRDSWAWMIGVGGPSQLVMGLMLLISWRPDVWVLGLLLVVGGINACLFWWGALVARAGLVALTLAWTVFELGEIGAAALVPGLIGAGVVTSILTSTRTKLFFRLDVSREALKKTWDVLANNVIARNSLALGLGGLLVPGMGLIAIACGVIGAARVNRRATPPIGKLPHAIAGIVLGLLGTGLTGWVAWGVFRSLHN